MSENVTNAVITSWEDVTADLAIVKVSLDSGGVPAFEPGQFCTLGLEKDEPVVAASPDAPARRGPRMDRRSYSIVSAAHVRDHYEMFVVLVPTGKLTPRLWAMKQGGRVWMQERADGMFTLGQIPRGKDLVMVATGTGLGPYVSMLRTYRGAAERPWRRVVVVHGTRLARDQAYRGELESMASADASVKYVPIVTREPEGSAWGGLRGRVHAALEPGTFEKVAGFSLDPAESHVFLCGNPLMITDVQAMLEGRGFVADKMRGPMGNIHLERYW